MTDTPDPVRDAYAAWQAAENAQAAAWDAYRALEPGADADAFMAWWKCLEQVDAARAAYYALLTGQEARHA